MLLIWLKLVVWFVLFGAPLCSSDNGTTAATNLNPTTTTLLASSTVTSCAANNATCNVTAPAPTGKTTTKHSDKWKSVPLQPLPTYYKFKMSNKSDCNCDLHNRFCDINCCCDRDCSMEAKQVFGFCADEMNLPAPNTMFCNYMQYIYNNRTLYEAEVQQNSLFCIVKTNLPAYYYTQKRKMIINPLHANVVIKESASHEWSNGGTYNGNLGNLYGNFTNYSATFGDTIYILQNYSTPQALELPASFITPDCITTKSVRYLEDLRTTCRQVLHERSVQLFLQSYQANWTTLTSLRFFNASPGNYEGCPKNVCIPWTIKQCDLAACWNISNSTKSICNAKICTNVVTQVKFTFTHNGTRGIQRVNVDLTLDNITFPNIAGTFVDQRQEVTFQWTNQTELNYSDVRSGQPGYQIGKPILFAKLLIVINATTNSTTNKTTYHETRRLQRAETKYIENFMVAPKNVHGKCALSDVAHESIHFGYNMLTKCVHNQGFVKQPNSTANATCWLLQNNILAYWSLDVDPHQHANTTRNATFGHFGNAQTRNVQDWAAFLFDVLPEELLNLTHGRAIGNSSIVCQNISAGIKYSIFYERVKDEQHRIAAVYVEFTRMRSVELNVFGGNVASVFSEVPLSTAVMFYDVTGVRDRRFVDPPSLNVRLPYDFFYPFIRVENRACIAGVTHSLAIAIVLTTCISNSMFLIYN